MPPVIGLSRVGIQRFGVNEIAAGIKLICVRRVHRFGGQVMGIQPKANPFVCRAARTIWFQTRRWARRPLKFAKGKSNRMPGGVFRGEN